MENFNLSLENSKTLTWKPVLKIFLISATPSKIQLVRRLVRFSHIESLESRLTGKPINEVEIYFWRQL